jgi:hypothetical protein
MVEPASPAGFIWAREPWGLALVCEPLSSVARHLFTTRHLALRQTGEDMPNGWGEVAASMGVPAGRLARLRQVHGAAVVEIGVGVDGVLAARPQGDVLVTRNPSVALAVQVADCVPILLADPRSGAVAAAHAGWRGTAAGAAAAAVDALVSRFGARAEDLHVAVGPSIGPCCYVVGSELAEAFRTAGHSAAHVARWIRRRDTEGAREVVLDLWAANEEQLRLAGVRRDRLFVARLCTACHAELLCSYRREKDAAGRMAGVIRAGRGRLRPSPGSRADRPRH